MSHIHVIHWSDDYHRGYQLEIGWPEASIVQLILDGNVRGHIDRVDWYDVGEFSSNDISGDIAVALAKRLDTTESIRPDLYDFIETHAGREYVQGLRRREMTFAAE